MDRFLTFLLVWVAGFSVISATEKLSLDGAIQRALQVHPELNAARAEINIARARLVEAGLLDNPELQVSVRSSLVDGSDREGSVFLGYNQKFPITDRLRRARELRVSDLELACAEVREVEREFVSKVQKHYIAAVAARSKIDVLRGLEEDSIHYVSLAKKQLAQALGSELDVAAAETEQILAIQARTSAQGEYREALARLRPMVGVSPSTSLELIQSIDSVISSLRRSVQARASSQLERSDVTAAKVRRSRAEAREQLAFSETLEDWEIAAGYQNERTVDVPVGVERDHFLGVGLRIPLPVRKKGQGKIAEAQAEKDKADYLLKAARARSQSEVEVALESVHRTTETLDSLQNRILPLLRERESKTRKAYQEGLTDFSMVIRLQQQQARTGEALLQAKTDQAEALAGLQTALGSHPLLSSNDYCAEVPPSKKEVCRTSIRAVPVESDPPPRKRIFGNAFRKIRSKEW